MSIHLPIVVNLKSMMGTCNELLLSTGHFSAIEDIEVKNNEELNLKKRVKATFETIISFENTLLDTVSKIDKKSHKHEFSQIKQDIWINRLLKKQMAFLTAHLEGAQVEDPITITSKAANLTIKIGALHCFFQKTIDLSKSILASNSEENTEETDKLIKDSFDNILKQSFFFDGEINTLLQEISSQECAEDSQTIALQGQIQTISQKNNQIKEATLDCEIEYEAWALSLTTEGKSFLTRASSILENTYLQRFSTFNFTDESIILCLMHLGFCSIDPVKPLDYLLSLQEHATQFIHMYDTIKKTPFPNANSDLRRLVATKNMMEKTLLKDQIIFIQTFTNTLLPQNDSAFPEKNFDLLADVIANFSVKIGSSASCASELLQPVNPSSKEELSYSKATLNDFKYFWAMWHSEKENIRQTFIQKFYAHRIINQTKTPITNEYEIKRMLLNHLNEPKESEIILKLKKQFTRLYAFMREIEKKVLEAEKKHKEQILSS